MVMNLGGFGQVGKLGRLHVPNWVDKQIISETAGGRPGTKLDRVRDIAIHYVANPGSTAQNNHDYFDQPETQVSAHFVVGLEGEIIQCIPLDEVSYATNDRNKDTISIEVCHPDESGKFNQATYDSLVKLTAWLCDNCGISRKDVIRHYDVTGKACPLYFVDHPDAWEQFLKDVKKY
jgi:N-acetylmuramoyl-L-alanine amidase CwlA